MIKVHFVGIGGTGISAIARVLLEKGWQVSGTDMQASTYFNAVTLQGAETRLGHHPDLAVQADLLVRSSAVKDKDPEVMAAREVGIPVLKRADFLPELTKYSDTLAVAGSHGKTTTTAMLIHLFRSAGKDPSFILGSDSKSLRTNAHAGKDKSFIIEAKNTSRKNIYVQSASLNGKALHTFHFPAAELLKGGTLVLEMGPEPNTTWGVE